MFPLWNDKRLQLFISKKRPSPKNKTLSHAHDLPPIFYLHKFFISIFALYQTIKETSLFTFLARRCQAAMTVEASLALPLFLFFFLNLSCSIELMRLHGNLEAALWNVGNKVSIYGYILTEQNTTKELQQNTNAKDTDWWEQLTGAAVGYTYVKGQIVDYLGKQYLEESPLKNGTDGLHFLESSISSEKDTFEITVTYEVSPWGSMVGFGSFFMANRYYGHIWNGYRIPVDVQDKEALETVYITESGEVYHKERTCSHLQISIQEVTLQQAYQTQNEYGEKYNLCERCTQDKETDSVYITKTGNCYHYSRDCPALKRTIYSVAKWEVTEYQLCSRCCQG